MRKPLRRLAAVVISSLVLTISACAQSSAQDFAATYRFLVSDREQGGVLYKATAGNLKDKRLPLSFVDNADYWAAHVCQNNAALCAITDIYDPQAYTLRPQKSLAGDLQTERVNTHNGTNIYDAATWQIAVMVGKVRGNFKMPNDGYAYGLVSNQNELLRLGYSGDAHPAVKHQNRGLTRGEVFRYNGHVIDEPEEAFVFRSVPRAWLSTDPLAGSKYDAWIKAAGLPLTNSNYQRGKITWTDWKPISGENAWAFLIGPLQAAHLHYRVEEKRAFVPFEEIAVQNALAVLPTFAKMQSPIGVVYYAPQGTVMNQGDELVNPYEFAVENNISIYAGLNILRETLRAMLLHDDELRGVDKKRAERSVALIDAMIDGGKLDAKRSTQGLLAFFRQYAWQNSEFIQGGFANDPKSKTAWQPRTTPKAVDVNTWGIAALGTKRIDEWFGFGAAFNAWRQVKQWGGYGSGKNLAGVGFSDRDGNGVDASGNYRSGVMSTEWTAGAIVAVRDMLATYGAVPESSADRARAQQFIAELQSDEKSMLIGLEGLRADRFVDAAKVMAPRNAGAYLYANKRYLIPFGWYANPLPSTCSAAWVVMVEVRFNPVSASGI